MFKKDKRLVDGLTSIDIRKQMEAEMPEFESVVLPDKWQYNPDVLEKPLPFTLKIGGWKIPFGMRAMINTELGEATLELLVDQNIQKNEAQLMLLPSIVERLRKSFENECKELSPTDLQRPKAVEITKVEGKILFVQNS